MRMRKLIKEELPSQRPQTEGKISQRYKTSFIISTLVLIISIIVLVPDCFLPPTANAATSLASSPVSWLTQMSTLSGQTPKLNSAPLIQFDTGAKYYKSMIDGMMVNFKKAVARASERSFSLNNVTSTKPINLVGGATGSQSQRVTIQDIQIDGLANPKVLSVYVNKKNMKLQVVFNYKTIKVSGRCSTSGAGGALGSKQVLMEATSWNASWSSGVMQMIGRQNFDLNKVFTQHAQQRLSLNLKECPQIMHDKLKVAILDRVSSTIDSRLLEIMETVMIHTDTLSDEAMALAATTQSPTLPIEPKGRGKRASDRQSGVKGKAGTKGGAPKSAPSAAKTSARRPNPIVAKNTKTGARKSGIKSPIPSNSSSKSGRTQAFRGQRLRQSQAPQKKALKRTKRQTPCQQGEELDDYVDQLFRFGTRIVRAMEPVTLPNATIELPDYNLKIFLYEGKGTRAYKFKRSKPAWVFCSNETISLGLTIEVDELRLAYKYRVISGYRLLFDGDLEAKLSPKVQAQFSQAVQEEDSEEPVQQRVDRVRVFRLGRVHVLIRGLGNLTQSLSMMINSYLNDNQEELQPTFRMVEGDAVKFINRMLANVNVPLLSVV